MHLSLDIVVERLRRDAHLEATIVRSERRRGISTVATTCQAPSDNELVVSDLSSISEAMGAQHLLVVRRPEDPMPDLPTPDLAYVRTQMSPEQIYALVCAVLVTLSNWDSRMLEAIATRQDVDAVLHIAAEQLANPIALFDSRQALLAYAGELTQAAAGTIWEDVLEHRFTPIEYFTREEQAYLAAQSRASWPYLIRPSRDPEHTLLSLQISVGGQNIGSIGQVDVHQPFTMGERALASLVAERLQLALSMRLSGASDGDTAYLLRSILNGNKADRSLVSHHVKQLGWKKDESLCLVLVPLPEEPEQSPGNSGRIREVAQCLPRSVTLRYEEHALFVTPVDNLPKDRLAVALEQLSLFGVQSMPFTSITTIRHAYDQCVLALSTLSTRAETPLVPFESRFEQVLTSLALQSHPAETLCHPLVLGLSRDGYHGDHERGRTLVRELYVYLSHGCNSLVTSRQLFLHRNTLAYHVDQMERHLGMKLTELSSSQRLLLMFSCLMALEER